MKIINEKNRKELNDEEIRKELLDQNLFLFKESFKANCNFSIIKQYHDNSINYNKEINYSPCFYQIIFTSLLETTLLLVSKLYDKNSINISLLLHEFKENINVLPIGERFYLDSNREVVYDSSESKVADENVFFIPFNFNDKLCDWIKKFNKMENVLASLKKQRDKIYAHHNINIVDHIDSFIEDNHVLYRDIENLISFALEVTSTIRACMTGVGKTNLVNIDDWENTLKMVRLADKHKEIIIQEELK